MKPLSLLTGLLIACSSYVYAQPTLGLYGSGVLPQKEIRNEGYKDGGAFRLNVLSGNIAPFVKSETPFFSLHVGGGLDIHRASSRSYDALVTPAGGSENLPGKLSISTNTFGLQAMARGYFGRGPLQPYVQAFVGPRWFYSAQTLSVSDQDLGEREFEDECDILQSSLSWHYGYGAGVRYMFNSFVGMDAGFDYSYGTKAQYLLPHKTTFEYNSLNMSNAMRNTRTNLLFINVGVVFKLIPCNHCDDSDIDFSDDSLEESAPVKRRSKTDGGFSPSTPKQKIDLSPSRTKVLD